MALVAPSIEDFGLTPLEAGAFAKPTLALRGGGYLDTVAEGVNGLFFDRPDAESIAAAVAAGRRTPWDAEAILRHGRRFDEQTFRAAIHAAVDGVLAGRALVSRSGGAGVVSSTAEGSPTVSKLTPSSWLTLRSLPSWMTSRPSAEAIAKGALSSLKHSRSSGSWLVGRGEADRSLAIHRSTPKTK